MTQNTVTPHNASPAPAGTFNMRMGKTTYVIGVHFSKTSKDSLEDKVKRLIYEEVTGCLTNRSERCESMATINKG